MNAAGKTYPEPNFGGTKPLIGEIDAKGNNLRSRRGREGKDQAKVISAITNHQTKGNL